MLSLALLFAAYLLAAGVVAIVAAMRAVQSHECWSYRQRRSAMAATNTPAV
jgi:hypothetical protein